MTGTLSRIEEYDNGFQTRFEAIGRPTVDGDNGALVRRIVSEPFEATAHEGSFEVFIPDRQSKLMWARWRNYQSGNVRLELSQ